MNNLHTTASITVISTARISCTIHKNILDRVGLFLGA